jgi:hypothetical protein
MEQELGANGRKPCDCGSRRGLKADLMELPWSCGAARSVSLTQVEVAPASIGLASRARDLSSAV